MLEGILANKAVIKQSKKMFNEKIVPSIIAQKTKYSKDILSHEEIMLLLLEKEGQLVYFIVKMDRTTMTTKKVLEKGKVEDLISKV